MEDLIVVVVGIVVSGQFAAIVEGVAAIVEDVDFTFSVDVTDVSAAFVVEVVEVVVVVVVEATVVVVVGFVLAGVLVLTSAWDEFEEASSSPRVEIKRTSATSLAAV